MKKNTKIIASIMLSIALLFTATESILAASYSWTATKTPGMTAYGETNIEMPLYKGGMTFELTYLYGDCSYLLAKVTSSNDNYYYVNTSTRSVMLTKVHGQQSFSMGFTGIGNAQSKMILKGYVEHNAATGKFVQASGIIFY